MAEDGKLLVSVADTGQGVREEHLSKIFDPFFTTKQVGKGAGLGLSVSFGIIQDHGGTISAQSPPPQQYLSDGMPQTDHVGPGTVFIVELPLQQEQQDVEPEEDEAEAGLRTTPVPHQ